MGSDGIIRSGSLTRSSKGRKGDQKEVKGNLFYTEKWLFDDHSRMLAGKLSSRSCISNEYFISDRGDGGSSSRIFIVLIS